MGRQSWPPPELRLLERGLDDLAESVRNPPKQRGDDEQVWLTRLLVVRSCGYLEQALHQCAVYHLEWKSGGTARSYALSWLERSINPSVDNLTRTLSRFDSGIAEEFTEWLEENTGELKQELSVLVSKRHGIAHGLNEGLGSRRALELYGVAKVAADWLILKLSPDPGRGSSYAR